MYKPLLVLLLSAIFAMVTLSGAVQSKRVLVGIYKSERALLQAKERLRTDPALVKIKRDYGFETVSRIKGGKRVLYLETFSKTKDLLSTFVVVSRKFPDSFIEEYMDDTPKALTPDQVYAKTSASAVPKDPFAPIEIPQREEIESPDTVEAAVAEIPDLPEAPEPLSVSPDSKEPKAPTAIDQYVGFEAVGDDQDDEDVLWEQVVLDDEEESPEVTAQASSDVKPTRSSQETPAVADTPAKPAVDENGWDLDFMKAPVKERPVTPVKKPAPLKQTAPKPVKAEPVAEVVTPEEPETQAPIVEEEVTPLTPVRDIDDEQYRRDAKPKGSMLNEVHEIKVVLDTKSMLLLLAGVILLLWFYKRYNSPKKEDPFDYTLDSDDDVFMQADSQKDLVDILINKKAAKAPPKRNSVDVFDTADEEIAPEWDLRNTTSAPKEKKEKPLRSYPLVVDIHSHMIPGIDDGSKNMKESVAMVRQLHALGYRKVITTPHIMSHRYPNTSKIILDGLDRLREELDKQGVDIIVEAAAEYYLDEHLRDLVNKKEILTFGKNNLLFELSYNVKPINLERWIVMMRDAGYQPVLAHPERYQYMRRNFKMYEELKQLGLYLQVNINSLNGFYAPEAKQIALKLAEKGMIDFLGSDAHAIRHLQALGKTVKTDAFAKIFKNNPIKNNTLFA